MAVVAIVGDLGGTNVRFRLLEYTDVNSKLPSQVLFEYKYLSGNFDCITSAIQVFLNDYRKSCKSIISMPQAAVFCVAGPCRKIHDSVSGNDYSIAEITALKWVLDTRKIATLLGIDVHNCIMMNDFEGVSYGILASREDSSQYINLNEGEVQPNGPIVVIGPGTGLGMGYLMSSNGEYHVCPSEGGHSVYPASTPDEFRLVQYIKQEIISMIGNDRNPVEDPYVHVSAERVASGAGMKSIYRFVKHELDPTNALWFPQNVQVYNTKLTTPECEVQSHQFPPKVVCEKAIAGDLVCLKVIHIFARALARVAGNAAVNFLPFGGIYIAGGMGAKLQFLLDPTVTNKYVDNSLFLKEYKNKGRLASMPGRICLRMVTTDDVGIVGCGVMAYRLVKELLRKQNYAL